MEAVLKGTPDLLRAILKALGCLEDLCRAAQVCRDWSAVAREPDFWRSINLSGRTLTGSKVGGSAGPRVGWREQAPAVRVGWAGCGTRCSSALR